MKQFLTGLIICTVGAIGIVSYHEYSDLQFNKEVSQKKIYKLNDGTSYFGTNEEALKLKQKEEK
jgi:hypothetical protein